MLHKRTKLTLEEICDYYNLEDTEYLHLSYFNEYAAARIFTNSRIFVPNVLAALTFRNVSLFNQFVGGVIARQDMNFLTRFRREHLIKILTRELLSSKTLPSMFILLSVLDSPENYSFRFISKRDIEKVNSKPYKEILDPFIDKLINHPYNDETLKLLIRKQNEFMNDFGCSAVCIEMLLNKYPNELIRKLKFEIKLEGE